MRDGILGLITLKIGFLFYQEYINNYHINIYFLYRYPDSFNKLHGFIREKLNRIIDYDILYDDKKSFQYWQMLQKMFHE